MRSFLRKILHFVLKTAVVLFVASLLLTVAYCWINPPITPLMISRAIDGAPINKTWQPINEISPNLICASIASEDNNFLGHRGFDIGAIYDAIDEHNKGKRQRGASTISQQTAKNVFLWSGRSWVRKGLEVYFTFLIEHLWDKERIMEVYLNVAETGKGIFGVETAARKYDDRSAAKPNTRQAVCIACVLPNPLVRSPKTVPQKNRSKYNITYKRTEQTPYPF